MGFISERERHDLRDWANEAMGEQRADIFMRSLPPNGWEELATKEDVTKSENAVRQEVVNSENRVRADLHELFTTHTTKLVLAFVGMMIAAIVSESVMPHWFPPPVPEIVVQVPPAP